MDINSEEPLNDKRRVRRVRKGARRNPSSTHLGYYEVCYTGDEVKNPGRVIPRSILISRVAVAGIYLAWDLSTWNFIWPTALTQLQSSVFSERARWVASTYDWSQVGSIEIH